MLVRVDGVSKKFCRALKRSLWYGLKDAAADVIGRGGRLSLRPDEFWAVKDVSFELRAGDCLGLVGRNGAGKTTLLKMLNGVIKPDAGRIAIRGRVGALIALGAGFNPLLTGRENIYVNGSVLGIRKAVIDRRLEEIVEFAEIAEFIDAPVQNYSSGMHVRLGFAVAVKLIEPDVLVLDEVVAVGDEAFRSKCYQAVGEMLGRCAVLFVSHSLPMIYRMSTQVMVLSNGETVFSGDPALGIERYLKTIETSDQVVRRSLGTGEATIHRFCLLDEHGTQTSDCPHGRPFRLSMDLTVSPTFPEYDMSITFMSRSQELVAQCHSRASRHRCWHGGGRHRVDIEFDAQLLNPGHYWINVVVFDPSGTRHLCWEFGLMTFTVTGVFVGSAPVQMLPAWRTTPLTTAGVMPTEEPRSVGTKALS